VILKARAEVRQQTGYPLISRLFPASALNINSFYPCWIDLNTQTLAAVVAVAIILSACTGYLLRGTSQVKTTTITITQTCTPAATLTDTAGASNSTSVLTLCHVETQYGP